MNSFGRFFDNMQQDLKAFLYWCGVLMLFRVLFIVIYSGQLNGSYAEVPSALLLGLRLSLKTAGGIALVGFAFATLPKVFFRQWAAKKIRLVWNGFALFFFSVCFMARIPYYKIFNAAFNMMLINGAHDDLKAIIVTAVEEYQLLWRLPLALIIGLLLTVVLELFLQYTRSVSFADLRHKQMTIAMTVVLLPLFCVFVRYGGAFRYADSINWESAARLKSNLLNEAVLDDGQALYRVRASKKLMDKVNNVQITVQELESKIAAIGGNPGANSVDAAFLRTVQQPKLIEQPRNVVVILGESFGQWPLLSKFQDINLTPQMLRLQAAPNAAHVGTMLAGSSGTIGAVNALVSGLPDTGLYENYQPQSFKASYRTGIGYIFKQLGYKTVFWYGGFSGWQNLKNFVLAQSFDEFHCADEFGETGGNAWGCPDEVLFNKIFAYTGGTNKKTLHVILVTSNHPPYTLPVDKLGFPRKEIRDRLPADIARDEKTLDELGHIWYADKTMGEFIAQMQGAQPDSLFVVTGDHSERFSFALEQDVRTISAIPCIFYGAGVQQNWLNERSVGCAMQLPGTLAELVAPAGYQYSAMMGSMLADKQQFVFNPRLYAKEGEIAELSKLQDDNLQEYAVSLKNVAAWRVLKGNVIK